MADSATPAFTHRFTLTLTGKGAHAARPHEGIDSIVVGSHIITALATLMQQTTRKGPVARITVTRFLAGNSWNVLPPQAQVEGVLLAEDVAVRRQLMLQATTLIAHTAQAFGAQAEIAWQPDSPENASAG